LHSLWRPNAGRVNRSDGRAKLLLSRLSRDVCASIPSLFVDLVESGPVHFAPLEFRPTPIFSFVFVRRYSGNKVPHRVCNSLCSLRFSDGGGTKWSESCPRRGTLFVAGGTLFTAPGAIR
jgi:hypothetical protein